MSSKKRANPVFEDIDLMMYGFGEKAFFFFFFFFFFFVSTSLLLTDTFAGDVAPDEQDPETVGGFAA